MLQDIRSLELLGPRKLVRLHSSWKQYIRRLVYLNTQSYFKVIIGLSLKVMRQSYLKNTMLTFEEQQQKLSTLTKLLWKPLRKNW